MDVFRPSLLSVRRRRRLRRDDIARALVVSLDTFVVTAERVLLQAVSGSCGG